MGLCVNYTEIYQNKLLTVIVNGKVFISKRLYQLGLTLGVNIFKCSIFHR